MIEFDLIWNMSINQEIEFNLRTCLRVSNELVPSSTYWIMEHFPFDYVISHNDQRRRVPENDILIKDWSVDHRQREQTDRQTDRKKTRISPSFLFLDLQYLLSNNGWLYRYNWSHAHTLALSPISFENYHIPAGWRCSCMWNNWLDHINSDVRVIFHHVEYSSSSYRFHWSTCTDSHLFTSSLTQMWHRLEQRKRRRRTTQETKT